jgi:hypothetical protein
MAIVLYPANSIEETFAAKDSLILEEELRGNLSKILPNAGLLSNLYPYGSEGDRVFTKAEVEELRVIAEQIIATGIPEARAFAKKLKQLCNTALEKDKRIVALAD